MTKYSFIEHDEDFELIDTDQIDELLALFNMHNLMPHLSKHEHVYANSLAMLVTSLHWSGNAKHLFESLPYVKGREIDLLDIINTMSNLGFASHNINMSLEEIDSRLMPCLFIPDKSKADPIVLLSKENDYITCFHSKDRKKVIFKTKHITGEAYFFEKINPDDIEEDIQTKKAAGLNWFDVVFQRFRPVVNEIVLTSILINIFALAMPLFSMSIYDVVIGSGSTFTLGYLIIGIFICIVAEASLRIIRLRSIVWLGVRLDNIVSNAIFERLLLMKAQYIEGASISSQISRIKTFESVRKFFTGPLFSVIVELPFTIILLFVIWMLTGSLVYIPLLSVGVFVLLLYYYQSKLRVAMRSSARTSTYRHQFGMETFLKIQYLHQNGMAKNWWGRYKEKLAKSSLISFKTNMMTATIETAAQSISLLSGVAIVTCGIQLIWANQITVGALVATMMLIWRILGPLQTLCSMLPRVEHLVSSIDQINKLMTIEVERQPIVLKRPIENLNGNVSLTNIGLRYSADVEPLFVGLDIDTKKGEVIAITGVNGSGKSSILKLINGLYRPQTGTIRIDEINIKQLEAIELRNYISYLPQVPNFFEGTIKENLLLTNPLASDSDIQEALIKARAYDEVMSLPKGLDTVIFGNNPTLPVGLVYNLNIARVFLKKGNLILLDEIPNASLNGPAGEAYRTIITQAKGKKTVFFVSQRDDFIKLADKVIVLKHGTRPEVLKSDEFIKKFG